MTFSPSLSYWTERRQELCDTYENMIKQCPNGANYLESLKDLPEDRRLYTAIGSPLRNPTEKEVLARFWKWKVDLLRSWIGWHVGKFPEILSLAGVRDSKLPNLNQKAIRQINLREEITTGSFQNAEQEIAAHDNTSISGNYINHSLEIDLTSPIAPSAEQIAHYHRGWDLSDRSLQSLPEWFSKLIYLTSVDLDGNDFVSIPRPLYSMPWLKRLYFVDNPSLSTKNIIHYLHFISSQKPEKLKIQLDLHHADKLKDVIPEIMRTFPCQITLDAKEGYIVLMLTANPCNLSE